MTTRPAAILVRHIRRMATAQGQRSDRELLERFAHQRDEAAFAALLHRHGPMVLRVGRRVLQNGHDAEDVFQAAFLVLARKAASLKWHESVANWLYGVAYHLALKGKAAAARRRFHESRPSARAAADPLADISCREALALLDEELARLPERLRAPLVLCYLEGQTRDEAAQQLGWSLGTLKQRLERGRNLLRSRLARRGVTLPAALVATALCESAGASAVPAAATLQAALQLAAGNAVTSTVSGNVAALVDAASKSFWVIKLKSALLLVGLCLLGATAGVVAQRASTTKQPEAQRTDEPKAVAQARKGAKKEQPTLEEQKQPRTDRYGDPLPPDAIARLGTVRWRHDAGVASVAFSPDGRTMASAAGGLMGRTIHLWDAATGKELRRLVGHEGWASSVAYSPDGKMLASGSSDNTIRLWEPATGKELRQLTGHQWRLGVGGVNTVLFSPDGATLISSGGDKTIRLWDVAAGKELREFNEQRGAVSSLALAPDGKTLAAYTEESGKFGVRLWEVATGKDLGSITQSNGVGSLSFSPDGKTLAAPTGLWGQPCTFKFWDVATLKEIRSFRGHQDCVFGVAFSADGKTLVSTSYDLTIRLWDVARGKELRQIGCPGWIGRVVFSPDEKALVSWGFGNTIQFWDLATGKELRRFEGHEHPISSVAFSPDGKLLASGAGWVVRLWDLSTKKEIRRLQGSSGYDGRAIAIAFSPDGKAIASGTSDFAVRLCETATGRELRRFQLGHSIRLLAFSADGTKLAVWDETGRALHLWDMAAGKELRRMQSPPQWIQSLAFSPDGKLLAAGSGTDLFVHVWDVATGKEVRQFGKHKGGLTCVAFSPDSKTLAGADLDHFVHLWEVTTGQKRLEIHNPGNVTSVVFSPDGRFLASANAGNNFKLGPDDKHLNTGNEDKDKIHLWDVADGKAVHRFGAHRGGVTALAFSPDGKRLASGSQDTTALLWDVASTVRAAQLRSGKLESVELEALWTDLATAEGAKVHRAIWRLVAAPKQSLPLMKERLGPAVVADPQRLARLLADLDSDDFAVREKAFKELEKLGEAARAALRKALDKPPSAEVRRRVDELLGKLDGTDRLRVLRAVEVLEHIGTPGAQDVLKSLAIGALEARLTQEAKAALERLGKRPAAKP